MIPPLTHGARRSENGIVHEMRSPVAYLLDVDNTLLDNDQVVADLMRHLDQNVGEESAQLYWRIFERLRADLGYADYLGALQAYRATRPHDFHILKASSFLINYPFETRLFPHALEVIQRLSGWGPTVILSDGDVVFQPRKIERSGLQEAVGGRVLIYVHKELELDDVERRYPADHYVMVDDKLRLLDAFKSSWGSRVTTVFPRQGHYATDPEILKRYRAADVTVDAIGDLLNLAPEELGGKG
jgi:FMN phosphatase YigB (HAD superfamily)